MSEGQPARVPFRIRFFYGSGAVADGVKNTAFNTFLLFYYTNVLGLPGTLSGAAIFIALCVDAVSDPLVGSYSDHFHSRWGRRHPFMYFAALPMGLCFWGLFQPPTGLGETGLFLWLTLFSIGVRLFLTFHMIPGGALVPEITEDYDERTSLLAWRYLFGWLGGLAFSQVALLYFFPSSPMEDGRLDPAAYVAIGWLGALMVSTSIVTCARGTHRLIPSLRAPDPGRSFGAATFADDFRNALQNPSFRMLMVGTIFAATAGGFNEIFGLYMNTYFWELSSQQIGVLIAFIAMAALLGFGAARPLSQLADKRSTAIALASFSIFFGPVPIFLRLLGWFPENHSAPLFPLLVGHGMIMTTAGVALGILLSSMVIDIVDENELLTGRRQEGIFVAALAFMAKAVSGFGNFLGGMVLEAISFPRGADPGAVAAEVLRLLGLCVGPGMTLLYAASLIFLARYRITRARHAEVLEALKLRRAQAAGGAAQPGSDG